MTSLRARVTLTLAVGLFGLLGAHSATVANEPAPQATAAGPDFNPVNYYRMYTGTDKQTHVERLSWPAEDEDAFGVHGAIRKYFSGRAKSVIVVSGKPNFESPRHGTGTGGELIFVLSGSSTGIFSNGERQEFKAGDIVLIQDQGSEGRAVRFGPDGYLAVTIVLDQ